MTDQLYCPKCGPKWQGAYDTNHRCVECGEALKAEKVMEKLKAVEEERDELAAHVERYHAAYVKLTNSEPTEDADTRETMYLATQSLMAEFDAIAESQPTTSLARIKAEWQAEAMESAANYLQHGEGKDSVNPPVSLRGLAIRLRHRATEPRS